MISIVGSVTSVGKVVIYRYIQPVSGVREFSEDDESPRKYKLRNRKQFSQVLAETMQQISHTKNESKNIIENKNLAQNGLEVHDLTTSKEEAQTRLNLAYGLIDRLVTGWN